MIPGRQLTKYDSSLNTPIMTHRDNAELISFNLSGYDEITLITERT